MLSGLGAKRRGKRNSVARAAWPCFPGARASRPHGMGRTPMLRPEEAGWKPAPQWHLAEALEGRVLLATVYVDCNPAITTRDGLSWDTAHADLQPVLTAAGSGTTIKVADGTYKPTSGTSRAVSFVLKNGVGLYGGYAGSGAIDPDARDVAAYPTILSGDIGTVGSNSDNSYHVVVGRNTDATAVLDGFTVTGGNANVASPNDSGAGMYNKAGSPILSNCTFVANSAFVGAGMFNSFHASPILTNCTFSGNTAGHAGGGMENVDSSPSLTNCIFSGNSVAGDYASGGGGMDNGDSSPTLTNCSFTNNSASNYGGGMSNRSSAPLLTNCTFNSNSAYASSFLPSSYGGAMYNSSSSPTLTNCAFSGNSSTYGGGLDNYYKCFSTLVNCVFNGNSATSGGGVDNRGDSSPTFSNCAFSANSASYGGGMVNQAVSPMLTNCTFSGNTASAAGGGMSNYNPSSQSPTLTDCIIWGNTAPSGAQIYQSGNTTTATYSDIQGGYTGTGNIDSDPLFVRNPSPGPDGQWGTADDDYGDLRLQAGSLCIDAGSNAAVSVGVTTDLAGWPRFRDIPGVHDPGKIVDMGAYEYAVPATVSGGAGNDTFCARLAGDGTTLQIWAGSSPTGSPLAEYWAASLAYWECATAGGDDGLTVDLSNGTPDAILSFTAGEGNDTLVLTGMSAATGLNVQPGQVTAGACMVACSDVEGTVLDALAGAVVQVGALTVGAPVGLMAGKGLVLRAGALSIAGAGSLDLADGQMILDYAGPTPAQAVRGWVSNGQVGTTPAIKSSGHLAMVDNALIHMPSLGGQALAGPFSQVLIMQALAGDANLDGQVDERDLLPVLANMGRAEGQWVLGDLDQDGNVDVDDFAVVQAHVGAGAMGGGLSAGLRVETAKARLEYKPALLKSSGTGQQDGAMNRTVQGKKAAKAKPRAKVKVRVKVAKRTV
jgi:hypothetical protein